MTDIDKDYINSLIKLSEYDFWVCIGEDLSADGNNILPKSRKQLYIKGKLWFEYKKKEIQELLCSSEEVKEIVNNKGKYEHIEYVSALIDIVGSFTFGLSPVLLSLIVTKYNINKLCEEIWMKY